MTLDLRSMLRGDVNRIHMDFLLEPDDMYGVKFSDKIHVAGDVTNQGGFMRLVAVADIPYVGECARCLDPVDGIFSMPFERTVVTEGTLSEEQEEENADEFVILHGGILDIDDAVRESLMLSFPMRLLCREDCLGLCPTCGKPLREGACGCSQKEIDPRWSVLASLLDGEGEADGKTDSQDKD